MNWDQINLLMILLMCFSFSLNNGRKICNLIYFYFALLQKMWFFSPTFSFFSFPAYGTFTGKRKKNAGKIMILFLLFRLQRARRQLRKRDGLWMISTLENLLAEESLVMYI